MRIRVAPCIVKEIREFEGVYYITLDAPNESLPVDTPVCLVVAGYEYLCGQFAPPGAQVRTMGYLPDGMPYIPHASYTRPLAFGVTAGQGVLTVSLRDVRVISFGTSAPVCQSATATPTPEAGYKKSCQFDLAIPQEGGFTHHEQPVGGTVSGVAWSGPSPVSAYVFYLFTQGATMTVGPATGGPAFFDANLSGIQFHDGWYCVGTYEACTAQGPTSAFTFLENTPKDFASTTYYLALNIDAPDSRTIMLDNGYWIARGTWAGCQPPEITPTPYPTWTPAATSSPTAT